MIFFDLRKSNLLIHLRPIIQGLADIGLPTTLIIPDAAAQAGYAAEFPDTSFLLQADVPETTARGITISAAIQSDAPRNTLHLNTLHHQPVKYWRNPAKHLKKIDGFLCWGPFQKDYLQHLNTGTGFVPPLYLDVGCPMLDPLFDGTLDKTTQLKDRGLDPALETVLYAPSWNPGLSLREYGADIFAALSEAPDNLNILLRLHPASLFSKIDDRKGRFSGGTQWADLIAEIRSARANVFDCSNEPDATKALCMSDHVLTDISSLAWDALAIDCNVFHINCPDWPQIAAQNRLFGKPRPVTTMSHAFLNAGVHYGNGQVEVSALPDLLRQIGKAEDVPPRQVSCNRLRPRLLFHPGRAKQATVDIVKDLYTAQVG